MFEMVILFYKNYSMYPTQLQYHCSCQLFLRTCSSIDIVIPCVHVPYLGHFEECLN